MADPCFADSRLKIERANRHVDELGTVLKGFLNTDFCRARIEIEPDTGRNVLKVEAMSALPKDIALCLGDAAHNLRSAYDYITTFVIGKNDKRITFPKGTKRDDVETSQSFKTIKNAAPKLADLILNVIQPYEGGDFAFWELGEIDNFDKHKLVIPVVSIRTIPEIKAVDENGSTLTCTATVGDGNYLEIVDARARTKVTGHGKPTAAILFPEGTPFKGDEVVETMFQLIKVTTKAVESLESFIFREEAAASGL